MKIVNWISYHTPSIILSVVYFYALTPLWCKPHGALHYNFAGGILGLCAYVLIDRKRKISTFLTIMVMGVMLLGTMGVFFMSGVKPGTALTIAQQSLSCFTGALGGVIFAGVCEGFMTDHNNKNDKDEKEG